MDKIQISFNNKQLKQLRNEKERLGLSIASIVRIAITNYFEKGVQ
jgi:hypothetical protein